MFTIPHSLRYLKFLFHEPGSENCKQLTVNTLTKTKKKSLVINKGLKYSLVFQCAERIARAVKTRTTVMFVKTVFSFSRAFSPSVYKPVLKGISQRRLSPWERFARLVRCIHLSHVLPNSNTRKSS